MSFPKKLSFLPFGLIMSEKAGTPSWVREREDKGDQANSAWMSRFGFPDRDEGAAETEW
jgi:hypothetical protein